VDPRLSAGLQLVAPTSPNTRSPSPGRARELPPRTARHRRHHRLAYRDRLASLPHLRQLTNYDTESALRDGVEGEEVGGQQAGGLGTAWADENSQVILASGPQASTCQAVYDRNAMVGAVVGSPPWRGSGYRPAVQMPTQNRIGSHWPSGGVLGQCCVDASAQPARSRNLIFFHPFVLMRDGAPLGARTPNLLILGPPFRLVAD
jgi:hypothetical protein